MASRKKELLDDRLAARVNKNKLTKFKRACAKLGRDYQDMLRELIAAFGEGRIKITPKPEQTEAMKEAYDNND